MRPPGGPGLAACAVLLLAACCCAQAADDETFSGALMSLPAAAAPPRRPLPFDCWRQRCGAPAASAEQLNEVCLGACHAGYNSAFHGTAAIFEHSLEVLTECRACSHRLDTLPLANAPRWRAGTVKQYMADIAINGSIAAESSTTGTWVAIIKTDGGVYLNVTNVPELAPLEGWGDGAKVTVTGHRFAQPCCCSLPCRPRCWLLMLPQRRQRHVSAASAAAADPTGRCCLQLRVPLAFSHKLTQVLQYMSPSAGKSRGVPLTSTLKCPMWRSPHLRHQADCCNAFVRQLLNKR